MPLKPEHKLAIVKALRSGEFKQATGELINNAGRMCCIAVACYVVTGQGLFSLFGPSVLDDDYTEEAANRVGLTSIERAEWVRWNDEFGYDFQRIADCIEQDY